MVTPNPHDRSSLGPRPRLEPTRPATLLVAAMATGALAWLGISNFYQEMVTLPWLPPLTLLGLALVEAVTAWTTKARIDRKPGTVPVEPLVVVRYAVLAKASSLAGAIFVGAFLGLTTWLVAQRATLVRTADDLPQAGVGLAGSVALVAAALWLEWACRVPTPPPGADPAGPPLPERGGRGEDRAEGDRASG
ncbi:MAG TPA: DUF3180 domain-containing protein [Micromonosporaceae bacterium]|nr:DUF3180 domain-containing protein [Micromonosporaceae bacterium]